MRDTQSMTADILKALGQPTRLKIVELLADGERCVCEIYPAIGEEQSNTSRHLNLMVSNGILSRRKEGPKIFYSVTYPEILDLIRIARTLVIREVTARHSLLEGA